jgi:hypothetical protein
MRPHPKKPRIAAPSFLAIGSIIANETALCSKTRSAPSRGLSLVEIEHSTNLWRRQTVPSNWGEAREGSGLPAHHLLTFEQFPELSSFFTFGEAHTTEARAIRARTAPGRAVGPLSRDAATPMGSAWPARTRWCVMSARSPALPARTARRAGRLTSAPVASTQGAMRAARLLGLRPLVVTPLPAAQDRRALKRTYACNQTSSELRLWSVGRASGIHRERGTRTHDVYCRLLACPLCHLEPTHLRGSW